MFNNKDSYTAKEYSRNKRIFKIIKMIIFAAYFFLLIFFINGIARNSNNIFGIFFISGLIYFALKIVNFLDRQNIGDRKRNYNTWGRGTGAEGVVGNQLTQLGPEYKTIPDFQTGHGNIDFIVIGPKGIFTIEVKAHRGIVSYKDDWILVNNLKDAHDMIGQTRAEMFWLINYLKSNKLDFPVTGILEFPNGDIDMNSIHGQIDGIWIGGLGFHQYVINKSQTQLSQDQINKIVETINNFLISKK